VLVLGASGGPFIISSTLQVISNVVDFGMDVEEAVSAPRVHHQWVPEHIFIDDGIAQDVVEGLKGRGHAVRRLSFFSSVQVIHQNEGVLYGASDPRKGGRPAGGGP